MAACLFDLREEALIFCAGRTSGAPSEIWVACSSFAWAGFDFLVGKNPERNQSSSFDEAE